MTIRQLFMLVFLISILAGASAPASEVFVYSTETKETLEFSTFMGELKVKLKDNGVLVFGEQHNTLPLQNEMASVIESLIQGQGQNDKKSWTLFWEFLDFTDQPLIDDLMAQLNDNGESAENFLTSYFKGANKNLEYTKIISVAKKYDGQVRGINLPRPFKQKVIKEGLQSLFELGEDYLPSDHYDGTQSYWERFLATMIDHVSTDKIPPYFTAQCLTDSVMAHHMAKFMTSSPDQLHILIAGNFHTDFSQGTIERLKKKTILQNRPLIHVHFVFDQDHDQYDQYKEGHPLYGPYADYIYFIEAQ